MTEQYQTVLPQVALPALASGISAVATSLIVNSASLLPSSGPFRIAVDSEIILVGSISGITLSSLTRGIEGSTAASHSANAAILPILTAAGLLNCPRSMTTTGDLEYLNSSGNVARLPIGTAGKVLSVSAGLPAWVTGTPGPQGPPGSSGLGMVVTDDAGIVGDGSTDCYPAWQALIDSGIKHFLVPRGNYRLSNTLTLTSLGEWSIEGEDTGLTQLLGAAGKAVVQSENNIFRCANIAFIADLSVGSMGFYSNNTNQCMFLYCRFAGAIGMYALDPFMTNWHCCKFNGQNGRLSDVGSNIGLNIHRATANTITGSSDFTGWREGLRCTGAGINVFGARFEVNGIGLRLGCDPSGNPYGMTGSCFHGISGEANDTFIRCQVIGGSSIKAAGCQGSTNSPSGLSSYGLDIQTAHGCTFGAMPIVGAFSTAAVYLRNDSENKYLVFQGIEASNDIGSAWNLPSPPLANVVFQACNN